MTTKLLSAEIALPVTTGTATSFSEATVVRLINTDTSTHVVSVVETAGGTGIGSMTMPGGSVEQIVKSASHCVFADSNKVRGAKVGFTN
jgi:uncharacterized cupredoxin-like copper-binding protein